MIGAHSHTHEHLADYTLEELQKEIETSNKIFLKEIKQTQTRKIETVQEKEALSSYPVF